METLSAHFSHFSRKVRTCTKHSKYHTIVRVGSPTQRPKGTKNRPESRAGPFFRQNLPERRVRGTFLIKRLPRPTPLGPMGPPRVTFGVPFGTPLAVVCDLFRHFGGPLGVLSRLGPPKWLRGCSREPPGALWARFGVVLGSIWRRCGFDVGAFLAAFWNASLSEFRPKLDQIVDQWVPLPSDAPWSTTIS